MTMCDGEVIYQDGKFTKVDRDAALKALHDDLGKALSDDEVERRNLSKALLPHAESSTPTTSTRRSTCRSTGRARWCEDRIPSARMRRCHAVR